MYDVQWSIAMIWKEIEVETFDIAHCSPDTTNIENDSIFTVHFSFDW